MCFGAPGAADSRHSLKLAGRGGPTGTRPPGTADDQAIDFGDLRRLKPVSRVWGFDRGLPIDRWYIERFLAARSAAIRGRVLEIGEPLYTDMFGGGRVTQSEILDVTANPKATYSCPLEEGNDLPNESFDCVILTQTLQYIYELRGALLTLHRILKREHSSLHGSRNHEDQSRGVQGCVVLVLHRGVGHRPVQRSLLARGARRRRLRQHPGGNRVPLRSCRLGASE